ncbi:Zinc finger CCCH domain-containing protein ZFN-like [Dendrobium catenatum]|uniref:Zinc finger CCCH domain-containing protein ZFN-like n=1 Tax=Dendrobium catenatum TaxID=906689 RepID=A0A2I0X6U7_9ASPA|nr:Zinc finger CCCH domain-containing protein ZFN-like [Dendrobium catenatum]
MCASGADAESMWQMSLRVGDNIEPGPFPDRPGEADCAYYLRIGLCRFEYLGQELIPLELHTRTHQHQADHQWVDEKAKKAHVVLAYKFEIHAGSTKKHPSYFIFLQNGKSLREVLKSCTGASLDMLEAAIQNSIGPLPPMKLSPYQNCKGVRISMLANTAFIFALLCRIFSIQLFMDVLFSGFFDTSRTGNFALLCNSCLETSHQQATPTPAQGMSSSAKYVLFLELNYIV